MNPNSQVMRYDPAMPDNFDPTTIQDPILRQAFLFLLNLVEKQASQIQAQTEEIQ